MDIYVLVFAEILMLKGTVFLFSTNQSKTDEGTIMYHIGVTDQSYKHFK